jgi:hypothetical protein
VSLSGSNFSFPDSTGQLSRWNVHNNGLYLYHSAFYLGVMEIVAVIVHVDAIGFGSLAVNVRL